MNEKVTLITGADRGMGFELARTLGKRGQHILLASRNLQRGQVAVQKLQDEQIEADIITLDVTNDKTIEAAVETIQQKFGYLDILINNAGIALDNYELPSKIDIGVIRSDFEVNFFGLISVTQKMLPLLKESQSAKIINISSAVGSLTKASDPATSIYQHSAVGYQASKTAVNMFTVDLANELSTSNVTVNAVNPG